MACEPHVALEVLDCGSFDSCCICVHSRSEELSKLLCATLSFGTSESQISCCGNDGLQKKSEHLLFAWRVPQFLDEKCVNSY